MHLKLTTYNIHRCIGTDMKRNPKRIGRVLRQINPDIIALQEVEYVNTIDELNFVSPNHGYNIIPGPTITDGHSKYGNALLSRFSVQRINKINLSYPGREKRGAIDVDINCHGKVVRIITTHLGLSPSERRKQAKKLLGKTADPLYEKSPTILMGDMNEWFLWGRPLRWMHEYFGHRVNIRTFPAVFPLFSLDRIWCHPAENLLETTPHRTPLSKVASDHLPLTAIISI